MPKRILKIYEHSNMIKTLVKRELRESYGRSLLSFCLKLIEPLCQIAVYAVAFSVIIRTNIDKYYVYLITGMVPWLFFDPSLRSAAGGLLDRQGGDSMGSAPKEILSIVCVTSNFVSMLFGFVVMFLAVAVSGIGFAWKPLICMPLVMMTEYVMTLGFVLMVSALATHFKDMERIITIILPAWLYMTPILYLQNNVPRWLIRIIKLNPMTSIVESFHRILYWKRVPSFRMLVYGIGVSWIVLLLGELIFVRLEKGRVGET